MPHCSAATQVSAVARYSNREDEQKRRAHLADEVQARKERSKQRGHSATGVSIARTRSCAPAQLGAARWFSPRGIAGGIIQN